MSTKTETKEGDSAGAHDQDMYRELNTRMFGMVSRAVSARPRTKAVSAHSVCFCHTDWEEGRDLRPKTCTWRKRHNNAAVFETEPML